MCGCSLMDNLCLTLVEIVELFQELSTLKSKSYSIWVKNRYWKQSVQTLMYFFLKFCKIQDNAKEHTLHHVLHGREVLGVKYVYIIQLPGRISSKVERVMDTTDVNKDIFPDTLFNNTSVFPFTIQNQATHFWY